MTLNACPGCDAPLTDGHAFCATCGLRIEEVAPPDQFDARLYEDPPPDPSERPHGVLLLIVLQIGGAALGGLIMLWTAFRAENMVTSASEPGLRLPFLILSYLLLLLPPLVGGIGMKLRLKWGWWLSAFAHLYPAVLAANALVMLAGFVLDEPSAAEVVGRDAAFLGFKYVGRVVFRGLIYYYLFREHVLAHFGIDATRRRRLIVQHASACAIIMILGSLIAWAMPV